MISGALVGLGAAMAAGSALDGWWTAGALLFALTALGATLSRGGAVAHAIAAVIVVAGSTDGSSPWVVPVVAVGYLAASEAGASWARWGSIVLGGGALSAIVVAADRLPVTASVPLTLVAVVAMGLALRAALGSSSLGTHRSP